MELLRKNLLRSSNSLKNVVQFYRRRRILPPEHLGQYIPRITHAQLDKYRHSKITDQLKQDPVEVWETEDAELMPERLKGLYQELVPSKPDVIYRNRLREKLERQDMMARRKHLRIPEFYVGSILAATISDQHAPDRQHRFVGLCIERINNGLWTNFILRNVVDNQAVEIKYDLYNPTLLKLEVLKLEKRLDANLRYLRDAPKEYSTIPFNMSAIPHPKDEPVFINTTKVPLIRRPWIQRWYLHGYRGIEEESLYGQMTNEELADIEKKVLHVDRYDLMKAYREGFSEADQDTVYRHVLIEHEDLLRYQEKLIREKVDKYKHGR